MKQKKNIKILFAILIFFILINYFKIIDTNINRGNENYKNFIEYAKKHNLGITKENYLDYLENN